MDMLKLKRLALLVCLSLAACGQIPPPVIPSLTFSASPTAIPSANPTPTTPESSYLIPLPTAAPKPSLTPIRELTDAFARTPTLEPGDSLPRAVTLPPTLTGLKIVTIYKQSLILWDDGTPSPLYEGDHDEYVQQPRLSPDGRLVAFRLNGELWVVDTNGKNPRKLFSTEQAAEAGKILGNPSNLNFGVKDFAWLPGTKTLLFSISVGGQPGPGSLNDLYRIDVQSGTVKMLLPPGEGGAYIYPSPDGKTIALLTQDRIILVDPDGVRKGVAFAFEAIPTFSEYVLYPALQWETGAGAAYLTIPPQFNSILPIYPARIWRLPRNGSPHLVGEFWTSEEAIFVSPGSPYLIYYDGQPIPIRPPNATLAVPKIVLHNLVTGSEKPLVDPGGLAACWTRDGRYVLMSGAGQTYRLDVQSIQIKAFPRTRAGNFMCLDESHFLVLMQVDRVYYLELASLDGATYDLGLLNRTDDLDYAFY